MPWVIYKGKKRTLAGVELKPGRQFLQAGQVNNLHGVAAGSRLFASGELSLAPVTESQAPAAVAKAEPKKDKK